TWTWSRVVCSGRWICSRKTARRRRGMARRPTRSADREHDARRGATPRQRAGGSSAAGVRSELELRQVLDAVPDADDRVLGLVVLDEVVLQPGFLRTREDRGEIDLPLPHVGHGLRA